MEKWIEGFEGDYAVTDSGDVVSYMKGPRRVLKGGMTHSSGDKTKKHYRTVCLRRNSENVMCYHHRLVAKAFVLNPENKPVVNHKDGNKTNNAAENLEWVTQSENLQHSWDTGLRVAEDGENFKKIRSETLRAVGTRKLSTSHKTKLLTPDMLEHWAIPHDLLDTSCIKSSYLETWNYLIDLFTLCDSEKSLSFISGITGKNPSAISLIRNGKRLQKARSIYDRNKNNQFYLSNYKSVLDYPDEMKLFLYKGIDE